MQKTEAILVKRKEVRETSLLLRAYSRDLGKLQGLVKGVRGGQAAVPWFLEPLTLQGLVLYERRRSGVALITACDLLDAFDPIRRDLVKTAYASYCLDLVDALTEFSDPHPEVFDFLLGCLRALEGEAQPQAVARFLEAHLLRLSGLFPSLDTLTLSPGARISLTQMLQSPAHQAGRLSLNRSVQEELRGLFGYLLQGVLDHPLKSTLFLHQLGFEEVSRGQAQENR